MTVLCALHRASEGKAMSCHVRVRVRGGCVIWFSARRYVSQSNVIWFSARRYVSQSNSNWVHVHFPAEVIVGILREVRYADHKTHRQSTLRFQSIALVLRIRQQLSGQWVNQQHYHWEGSSKSPLAVVFHGSTGHDWSGASGCPPPPYPG